MKQSIAQTSGHVVSHNIGGSEQYVQELKELQTIVSANNARLEQTARGIESIVCMTENALQLVPPNIQMPKTIRARRLVRHSRIPKIGQVPNRRFQKPTIMLAQLNHPESTFLPFADDCHDVLLSLLLIQRQLNGAFAQFLMEQDSGISRTQWQWLLSEIQLLLTTAIHNSSDATFVGESSASRASSEPSHDKSRSKRFSSSCRQPCALPQRSCSMRERKSGPSRVWRFESTFGRLDVCNNTQLSLSDSERQESFSISFTPLLDVQSTSTAVVATFRKLFSWMQKPQIERQLHLYRLIPYRESRGLYELVEMGSLRNIDEAFRCGRASPFVLDFIGRPIHYVRSLTVDKQYIVLTTDIDSSEGRQIRRAEVSC